MLQCLAQLKARTQHLGREALHCTVSLRQNSGCLITVTINAICLTAGTAGAGQGTDGGTIPGAGARDVLFF